jgi:hypothetical protein
VLSSLWERVGEILVLCVRIVLHSMSGSAQQKTGEGIKDTQENNQNTEQIHQNMSYHV